MSLRRQPFRLHLWLASTGTHAYERCVNGAAAVSP